MKSATVTGAGGMIGHQLVKRLKRDGYYVVGIDRKKPEFEPSDADYFLVRDLRNHVSFDPQCVDEVYCLAAEMGGADYVFSGENDAEIMRNSMLINLNSLEACRHAKAGRVFFSSSACIYPDFVQYDTTNCALHEDMAYPARPDSEYGFEKLFAERLYTAYHRNYGLCVRIGRYHNIFSTLCTWQHGREKAPAAICRKVAETPDGGTIDIYGDGKQTRSFLYIDECIEGTFRLTRSDVPDPVNIGSSEMVSINQLASIVMDIANKDLKINHIQGPLGVRGRSSDNTLIQKLLGWAPSAPLRAGLEVTYKWISEQVKAASPPQKESLTL